MEITPYISDVEKLETSLVVDGNDNALHNLLKRADVKFEINKIPTANFVLVSSLKDEDERALIDGLVINKEIEFSLGGVDNQEVLFTGFIKSIEKNVNCNGSCTVKLACKDLAFQLTEETLEESFDLNIEEKIDEIIAAPLVNNIDIGGWGEEMVTQTSDNSNWDYLLSFLDSIGQMVVVRNGEFSAVDINVDLDVATYLAEKGINLHDINITKNGSEQLSSVKIITTRTGENELTEVDSNVSYPSTSDVISPPIRISQTSLSVETLQLMVNAIVSRSFLAVTHGTIKTFGNITAQLGQTLNIKNFNEEIDDQDFLITKERHTVENGCWNTEYTIGLESAGGFAQSISSQNGLAATPETRLGLNNSIPSLQLGRVIQLEDDPEELGRIKISIPTISNNDEGLWARLSSIQAGNERGGFFIPEVGDEVIVGFLDNTSDNPVVLGMVYNSENKPPLPITADNFIQGIVSKEETSILIDDEKKSIELSTKAGNKLLISDDENGLVLEDANGNKIVMSDKGIVLDSASDISIKAKGKIEIEGMQSAIKASTQMEIKGQMIKLN